MSNKEYLKKIKTKAHTYFASGGVSNQDNTEHMIRQFAKIIIELPCKSQIVDYSKYTVMVTTNLRFQKSSLCISLF